MCVLTQFIVSVEFVKRVSALNFQRLLEISIWCIALHSEWMESTFTRLFIVQETTYRKSLLHFVAKERKVLSKQVGENNMKTFDKTPKSKFWNIGF